MGRLTRRGFLARLGSAAIALTLARHLPGIAPTPPVLAPPMAVTALHAGDVFTIAGQYAFNPQTREEIPGVLARFVVLADVTGETIPREWIWLANGRVLGDVPIEQIQMGW